MAVHDGIVEGQPVIDQSNFTTTSGFVLDTSLPLDQIVGTSTAYQATDGQLKAGHMDANVQTYATKDGYGCNQINGERVAYTKPNGTGIPTLEPFSLRPNGADPAKNELVITSRPPVDAAEQDKARYRGYYVMPDGSNATFDDIDSVFPNGPPSDWEMRARTSGGALAYFENLPATRISGMLTTQLRYAASFFRLRVVCSLPVGARDNSNTPPRVRGETYNGKQATDFTGPEDMGRDHKDIDAHFPAACWTLQQILAGHDLNGEFVGGSTANTPGNIAASPQRCEIDGVEGFGFTEQSAFQTVHFFGDPDGDGRITTTKNSKEPAAQVPSIRDFHEYILDLTPGRLGLAIDGVYTHVMDTPLPFSSPLPVFVPDSAEPYKPARDSLGNAVTTGETQKHADGSDRYPQHISIINFADAAKFIRSFAFNSLTHPDQDRRDKVPAYTDTDELVIREWEQMPLVTENPDAFGVTINGVLTATPTTVTTGGQGGGSGGVVTNPGEGGDPTKPPDVTGLALTRYSDRSGALSWTPATAGTGYLVLQNGREIVRLSDINNNNAQLEDLEGGGEYIWSVFTLDGDTRSTGLTIDQNGRIGSAARIGAAGGYQPGDDGDAIGFRPGLVAGTVTYYLKTPRAGTWDFSSYGGSATAIGPTDSYELTLEVDPVDVETVREVFFVPA